jgi:hypothetical protein
MMVKQLLNGPGTSLQSLFERRSPVLELRCVLDAERSNLPNILKNAKSSRHLQNLEHQCVDFLYKMH